MTQEPKRRLPIVPESRDLTVRPPQQRTTLILEGDPEAQLEYAQKAARALMKRVEAKKRKVIMNGRQYLEFGDWQTLGRFFGATVGIERSSVVERSGILVGYEARAIVYQHGAIISSAEALCLRSEKNWAKRDEYAIKSMAQTRASAKALRNAFGWVAELAGYASTPADEMDADDDKPAQRAPVPGPPHDGAPYKIIIPGAGASAWSATFLQRIGAAKSQQELASWDKLNDDALQRISDTDPDLYERIRAAVERRMEDLTPAKTTETLAAWLMPDPRQDPQAAVNWVAQQLNDFKTYETAENFWNTIVAPREADFHHADWAVLMLEWQRTEARLSPPPDDEIEF